MVKLPSNATNSIFIACLVIMLSFTLARDRFRKPNYFATISKHVQIWLSLIAIANYIMVIVFTNKGN
jgi:hypothetical protein